MENFYLEKPSLKRKNEALDYINEHILYCSQMNGIGSLDRCLDGITYNDWLLELEKKTDEEYMKKLKWAPSFTYFLIRKNDDRIVGMINLRYNISEEVLKRRCTHIGYGIRPTERGKGYAKIGLYLGLLEERKLNENKVILVCTVKNIASNKTILALGGTLERQEIDDWDNELSNYYVIDVNKSIKKYHNLYGDYITNR